MIDRDKVLEMLVKWEKDEEGMLDCCSLACLAMDEGCAVYDSYGEFQCCDSSNLIEKKIREQEIFSSIRDDLDEVLRRRFR